MRAVGGELERVAVAARDQHGAAALALRQSRGREEIVRLVARRLRIREAACGDKLRQGHRAARARRRRIRARFDRPRTPRADRSAPPACPMRRARRAAAPSGRAAAANWQSRGWRPPAGRRVRQDRLRQGVIGAVREGIAVDDQQRPAAARFDDPLLRFLRLDRASVRRALRLHAPGRIPQHDPGGRMIAAHAPRPRTSRSTPASTRRSAACGAQQQMIEAQPGVARPAVPHVVPERVHRSRRGGARGWRRPSPAPGGARTAGAASGCTSALSA